MLKVFRVLLDNSKRIYMLEKQVSVCDYVYGIEREKDKCLQK